MKEEQRARDLFLALWIPDLFMKRVKANQDWTLFCPNEAYDPNTGKGQLRSLHSLQHFHRWWEQSCRGWSTWIVDRA